MNIHNSYFSIINPLQLFSGWLHPYKHNASIILNNRLIQLEWTNRANSELINRNKSLIIEMQLYFSCMVKKRVLFHSSPEFTTTHVNEKLAIAFRAVQSTACDPVEFAKNFPVKKVLTSSAAQKMRPSKLQFDFQNGNWHGEYFI